MKFKCHRCKKLGVRVGVNLFLDIPDTLYANLSKKNLRNKEVHIHGAGWDKAYFYCPRYRCGWNTHMSTLDDLKKENLELRKKLGDKK